MHTQQIYGYLREFLYGCKGKTIQGKSILPAIAVAAVFILLPASSTLLDTTSSTSAVPLIEIVSVTQDETVTIRTHNFPANTDFVATMGQMGTKGVGGTEVGNVNSGSAGNFEESFDIPDELKGSRQISIRLQSPGAFPYFSYNWFYNNTTGGTTPEPVPPIETPPATLMPSFIVTAVQQNNSVSIQTNNFPPNQTFTVTMGPMGTRGSNGIVVGTLDSGVGGTLTASYAIPAELHGMAQISIRTQTSHANPYFAYNWFYNNSTQ